MGLFRSAYKVQVLRNDARAIRKGKVVQRAIRKRAWRKGARLFR